MHKKATRFQIIRRGFKRLQKLASELQNSGNSYDRIRKFQKLKRRILSWMNKWKLAFSVALSCTSFSAYTQATFDYTNGIPVDEGMFVQGVYHYGHFGKSLDAIGDFNGDGIDDVVVSGSTGAYYPNQSQDQSFFVLLGKDGGYQKTLGLDTLASNVAWEIKSPTNKFTAVHGIGDVNGDNLSDILIQSGLRSAHIVFGKSISSTIPALNLSEITKLDGRSIQTSGNLTAIGKAGDVNQDGLSDFTIATKNHGYIFFGNNDLPETLSTASFSKTNGVKINIDWGTYEWIDGINSVGDLNDDGYDDVGINKFPGSFQLADTTYVVFGQEDFPQEISYNSIKDDVGFKITSLKKGSSTNTPATSDIFETVGDINGDGIDDLVTGRGYYYEYNERSHVVFGSKDGFDNVYVLDHADGSEGFDIGMMQGGYSNIFVGGKGDFNNDGVNDIVISEEYGNTYVVFGNDCPQKELFDLTSLDGENGITIKTNNHSYKDKDWLAMADMNNDGIDDVVIGVSTESFEENNVSNGALYVVYGEQGEKIKCPVITANIESKEEKYIRVYPNPAQGKLSIQGIEGVEIPQIIDVLGNKISANYENGVLDIESLQVGIYLLKVGSEQIKFIKE